MRFLLLLILSLCLSLALHGQHTKITFSRAEKLNVEQVLDQMVAADLPVIFSPSNLPDNQIFVSKGTYSPEELFRLLESTGVTFVRSGRNYLVRVKPAPQVSYSISGFITDEKTGEALIGATVSLADGSAGTVTNNYGYYSLTVRGNSGQLAVSYVGYERTTDSVSLADNTQRNFGLKARTTELDELVVSSRKADFNIANMVPGHSFLDYSTSAQLPYFLGEVDLIQRALLLPGIRTLGEDAAGLNIRGGDIDQNLLLLDEAVIYNPNHFYGLISVFNPEAVNRARVMKGFIPPEYGGRASSVITVHQKEGNKNSYRMSGGLGLVSARLMAEGPIDGINGSFLVSGRQSLYDLSIDRFDNSSLIKSKTSFQDVNFKLNSVINERNTIFLSGYFGNDRNRAGFDAIRKWGNRMISARWNHNYSERLFANYTTAFSDYKYRITNPVEAGSFIATSRVVNHSVKLNHEYHFFSNNKIQFGTALTFHRLMPGERLPFDENSSTSEPLILDNEHGLEYGLYASHETQPWERLTLLYGLRLSGLITFGPAEIYRYNPLFPKSDNTIADTLYYDRAEIIDTFSGIEPRISLNWRVGSGSSLKSTVSYTNQYIHLISNTASPAPTDIWKLSDQNVKPVWTRQYSVGYYQNLAENKWETSIELYYKAIDNIIEYKTGADLLFNDNPETELLSGEGRAYGIEYFLEKRSGKYRGWLSYTLSRAERRIEGRFSEESINEGNYFPADHDKTHDVSLAGIVNLKPRLVLSGTFNYSTGRPITFPQGKYVIDGTIVPYFEDRNQNRITDYHRLDLSVQWSPRPRKKDQKLKLDNSMWTFSIYNVYARKNAYSYFFRQSETDPALTEVIRYSIFGTAIPAITYNFRF